MDYGCIVYSSASHSVLKRLYSVNNEALRICTGAFKTSPTSSLYAECHEMPPQYRHCQLALQYAIKLKSNQQNPAYDEIFHVMIHSLTISLMTHSPRTKKSQSY